MTENIQQENEKMNNYLKLPLIPLRGKVAFPNVNITFEAGRAMTLKAIELASAGNRLVMICAQRETEKDQIDATDLYSVGCVGVGDVCYGLQSASRRPCCQPFQVGTTRQKCQRFIFNVL